MYVAYYIQIYIFIYICAVRAAGSVFSINISNNNKLWSNVHII